MPFGEINEEKEIKFEPVLKPQYVKEKIKKSKKKLEKNELLKLLKEKGRESIDPDHNHLAEYLFPKKDTRNNKYLRRNILASFDFLLAYCDIYLK